MVTAFVGSFLAALIGIDLYLLCGREDVLPVLGSPEEFPIRATTKASAHLQITMKSCNIHDLTFIW